MHENFIVDWQGIDAEQAAGSFASLTMLGRKSSLYRVEQVVKEGMLPSQAISLPDDRDVEEGLGRVSGAKCCV